MTVETITKPAGTGTGTAFPKSEVAAKLQLVPTAITYYFGDKEDLAAACFAQAIETHTHLIAEASRGATVADRLARKMRHEVRLLRRIKPIQVRLVLLHAQEPTKQSTHVAHFRSDSDLLFLPRILRVGHLYLATGQLRIDPASGIGHALALELSQPLDIFWWDALERPVKHMTCPRLAL